MPDRLDAILFEDRRALRDARRREDARIIAYIDGLSDEKLTGPHPLSHDHQPDDGRAASRAGLTHFFNHQTHHRGQAHCLLTGLTGEAPSFDLILFQRESGMGAS